MCYKEIDVLIFFFYFSFFYSLEKVMINDFGTPTDLLFTVLFITIFFLFIDRVKKSIIIVPKIKSTTILDFFF